MSQIYRVTEEQVDAAVARHLANPNHFLNSGRHPRAPLGSEPVTSEDAGFATRDEGGKTGTPEHPAPDAP